MLIPASTVFRKPVYRVDLRNHHNWWSYVPGADWRDPQGPGSSIKKRRDHPVVHVAWEDVEAYTQWAGSQLPTEAEWEFAARGGLDGATYAWGEELTPCGSLDGQHLAGRVSGREPQAGRLRGDRAGWLVPAERLRADMTGNVWEWTTDWFEARAEVSPACCSVESPQACIPRKVMKGGSHLCAPNYCQRYRPAARMPQPIDTSTSHLGFRTMIRGR